jgi:osmotically-inducible protein OsmY
MKKILWVWFLVVASTVGFFGCEPGSQNLPKGGSQLELKNAELEESIKRVLRSDEQLGAAQLDVKVDVARQQATLSGMVESATMREKAVDLAKSVEPNLIVSDRIEIKPMQLAAQGSVDHRAEQAKDKVKRAVEDTWLHGKILAKLIGNGKTPARNLSVDVEQGHVTLRGSVESQEAKVETERLVQETEGVKRVDNQIKIVPPVG